MVKAPRSGRVYRASCSLKNNAARHPFCTLSSPVFSRAAPIFLSAGGIKNHLSRIARVKLGFGPHQTLGFRSHQREAEHPMCNGYASTTGTNTSLLCLLSLKKMSCQSAKKPWALPGPQSCFCRRYLITRLTRRASFTLQNLSGLSSKVVVAVGKSFKVQNDVLCL